MGNKAGKAVADDEKPTDDDELDVNDDGGDDDESDDDNDFADTIVLSDSQDDEDDSTAEVNVEQLIAELEKTDGEDAARRKAIRRRLEELAEEKSFEDTYAVDFD